MESKKMVNLLTKTKIWMTASLLSTASLFAQPKNAPCRPQKSFEQGHELFQSQLIAGYNAPANIDVRDSWDLYVTASYIFWQAQEENLEIGLISQNNPEGVSGPQDTPFTTTYKNDMNVTAPNFTYRPGFKFGIGGNLGWDGWDAFAEYTWFHGSTGSGVQPLVSKTTTHPIGQYLYPIQGEFQNADFFQNANQSWGLKMDLFDISLGRSYYSGTKMTLRPFFGTRAAWIRQDLNTTYTGSTNYTNASGYFQGEFYNSSVSWGLGPRAGFDSNWLLGYGMRLIGNGSADLLYTRYETQANDQIFALNSGVLSPISENASVSQTVDYLRTHAALEMGFGWGSYFDNNNWHVDLSATYGFQIFWDQNMFRNFENPASAPGKSFAPNGNLYVHGLTVNGRLDF
jgi:hypothetical protein